MKKMFRLMVLAVLSSGAVAPRDGKVARYQVYEDTVALASALR